MTALALPGATDALTTGWLTAALRSTGVIGESAVTAIDAQPVGQGAGILCQLYRLTVRYDRPEANAPRTIIAKRPTAVPETRGMVTLFRFYEREVRFYQEVAPRVEMRSARVYYSAFDPASGDFILLLEDLADARIGDQLASCSVEDAALTLQEAARLHAAWWQHPKLDGLTWMPVINDQTNKMGLSLYPQAWPVFIERFGHALPEAMRLIGERLGAQINAMLDSLADGPRTICHGDLRLDNLFFGDGAARPPLTVIDWQITTRATGAYDAGYFIGQSLDPETRRAHERDLLKLYHETLVAGGVRDYSFDRCLEDYRRTLLFCFVYPVMGGGLGDLANERGHALGQAMMTRSATAILDWDAGELLDG